MYNFVGLLTKQLPSIEILDLISLAIGFLGLTTTLYFWEFERRNKIKATLYYPLYVSCKNILEVFESHTELGEKRSQNLLIDSSKTLDKIMYSYGSGIYLKKQDLHLFLSVYKNINKCLFAFENNFWAHVEDMIESKEFQLVKEDAKSLLSRCEEEEEVLKNIME